MDSVAQREPHETSHGSVWAATKAASQRTLHGRDHGPIIDRKYWGRVVGPNRCSAGHLGDYPLGAPSSVNAPGGVFRDGPHVELRNVQLSPRSDACQEFLGGAQSDSQGLVSARATVTRHPSQNAERRGIDG